MFNSNFLKESVIFFENKTRYISNKDWKMHSINVAICAYLIAESIEPELINKEKAFSCGLLHDIGRIYSQSYMKHVIYGYDILQKEGYIEESMVCLTHSFYLKNTKYYQGEKNCSTEELFFIDNFLKNHKFSIYDLLIQLCDALATSQELCIIEKRLVDVVKRLGFKEYTIKIWQAIFDRKKYFDLLCNKDIYIIVLNKKNIKKVNKVIENIISNNY